MERLTDIVRDDLHEILYTLRDFTHRLLVRSSGEQVIELQAAVEAQNVVMTSDAMPLNAFSLALYYEDQPEAEFSQWMLKNSIIYLASPTVEGEPEWHGFRILDSIVSHGLRVVSLERQVGGSYETYP